MAGKMYRSSQGKSVDLGALLLQNENVRAVGNMGVNARGDRIDNKNKSIDSRVPQKTRQYNKQVGPADVMPSESSRAIVEDPVVVPTPAPVAKPKKATKKKTTPKKVSTPVVDESIIDVAPAVEEPAPVAKPTGLADAIARAKQIKQTAITPPKQQAQQSPGVKRI